MLPQADSPPKPHWLDALNPEQRRAATHGGAGAGGPLLVIAGAGTGKTATLAHRVAHTIVSGADPQPHPAPHLLPPRRRRDGPPGRADRRRGAGRRRGRRRSPGRAPSTPSARGSCANTPPAIGLLPDFTILDREDSADLMNIVRHELGLSKTEARFPQKGTCLVDLLPRRQCRGAARRGAEGRLPLVPRRSRRACAISSPPMSRPSSARPSSTMTTSSSTGPG